MRTLILAAVVVSGLASAPLSPQATLHEDAAALKDPPHRFAACMVPPSRRKPLTMDRSRLTISTSWSRSRNAPIPTGQNWPALAYFLPGVDPIQLAAASPQGPRAVPCGFRLETCQKRPHPMTSSSARLNVLSLPARTSLRLAPNQHVCLKCRTVFRTIACCIPWGKAAWARSSLGSTKPSNGASP